MADNDKEPTSDLEILAQAREDFTLCQEGEKQMREEYSRCMRFIALEQYPDTGAASKGDRGSAGLPSLVVDQCNPACNQIINDWIRNRVGINIGPADAAASEKTAKIFNGYVRQLEYASYARRHYDQAFRNMTRGGRGYIGALTRRKPGTFRQEMVIRGFPDSQAVYMDPFCQEIDLTDNNVSFVRQVLSKAAFKQEHGKDFDCDFADWGAEYVDWITKDGGGIVAEYWKVKYVPRKFQKLTQAVPIQRGTSIITTDEVYDDEYDKLPAGVEVAKNPDDGGARWEEDEPKRKIIQRKITGKDILSETEWLGKIIPIVPMVAKCIIVDGKKRIFSAISGGLDPQCQTNYAESYIATELGSTVAIPWVGAVGQFKSQRQSWQDANIVRFSFLEYDLVAAPNGTLAPPPAKPSREPQIQAASMASDRAQNNFRTSTGINKSSLGMEDGRAISGVAKKALISEGDNNTFDFPDAGALAVQLIGDIIVDVWPKIASEPEIIQILSDEEKQESVLINADPKTFKGAPKDQIDVHMLDQGEYKVRVSAAPSNQTMREDTEQAISGLYKEMPDVQKLQVGDLVARSMDFNGKEVFAERITPPEFKKPKEGAPAIPPEAQAVIEQGKQLIDSANQHIALLERERDAKIAELESREKIAAINGETSIAVARIAAEAKTGISAFEGEIQSVKHMLDMITSHLGMAQQQESQESAQGHAKELQMGAQAHAGALQEVAQDHQAGLQDSSQQAAADQAALAQEAAAANGGGE